MTRIGHDQNRPMIRIGFYGTASDIAQWEESLASRLPPGGLPPNPALCQYHLFPITFPGARRNRP